MSTSGWPRVRLRHVTKLALLGAAVAAPLAVATAMTLWPSRDWHSGPIGLDLEKEQAGAAVVLASLEAEDPAGAVAAAREAEMRPAIIRQTLTVGRGDTLMAMLVDAGLDRREAHGAIAALRDVFRPRDLKPGQDIEISLAAGDPARADGAAAPRLIGLGLQPSVERDVRVSREGDAGFVALTIERPLERRTVAVGGTIESNLSLAARSAGLPLQVMAELIRMYSFDVDFQRDLRGGDSFEVLYDALFEENGALARPEDIVYAALTLSGKRLEFYRFTPKSGDTDYFDAKGDSVRKTLMRTPIDGGRLSSGFGMRRHPVLGYSKMHRGIDFAAPRGTPIFAAGDGTVESAGRNGSYGKYVRIRHNSTYKTAYAHMSRYGKGIRKGTRVRQGQVIGYVGSTGRSTGPHLHYEVMVNGRQVSPRKVKLPSGEKLKGKDLEAFAVRRAEIDSLREKAFRSAPLMVKAECADDTAGNLQPASGCDTASAQ